jgi:hypothetical protein
LKSHVVLEDVVIIGETFQLHVLHCNFQGLIESRSSLRSGHAASRTRRNFCFWVHLALCSPK